MGFLFPLFLLAAAALAIPVLIHLFNLRRYKRVLFPDTRFLRNIQLSTKRQSKIRDRRLLALRLLFLAALILAFAQPYIGGAGRESKATVTVIYIDNSYSMTLGSGQENLLQQARNRARQLIGAAGNDSRFLLLSNGQLAATRPMLRNEALQALDGIKPVSKNVSLKQIMGSITAAQGNEKNERWDVYLFSDLQQSTFAASGSKIAVPANTRLYIYPFQVAKASNLYIDTAYFLSPTLDTRQPNALVVAVKHSGEQPEKNSNLQVSVGNQVRAVSVIDMGNDTLWTDTLALQLNGTGWQDIAIALQDHPLSFDDTFRIAARTAPNLSVLIVSDQAINPYLQAAFKTYEGFRVMQENVNAIKKEEWKQYSLIVLQNSAAINPAVRDAVKEALQRGQNILLFPGNIANVDAYNEALKSWGDISFGKEDTARQQVVTLQQAHPLLQDLFEKVPENVQLPLTLRRYPIDASIAANQQALMSFRDGRPFLAQYALQQGKLYICATSLDDRSSNFALSYFFVPVLYKMAVQNGGNNMYAVSVGSNLPLWLPVTGNDQRKVWHLRSPGFDAIPAQRPSGAGVEVFAGNTAKDAGFYTLNNEASPDSVLIALNTNRAESLLQYADKSAIEKAVQPAAINWLNDRIVTQQGWNNARTPFPLWKVGVIVALVCLLLETLMLYRKGRTSGATVTAGVATGA